MKWVMFDICFFFFLFLNCAASVDSTNCMVVLKITPPFIHSVIHSFIPRNLWEFRVISKTAAATAASTVQRLIQVSWQCSSLSISLSLSLSLTPSTFSPAVAHTHVLYTNRAHLQDLLVVRINHYGTVWKNNPLVHNTRVLLLLLLISTTHATGHILHHLPWIKTNK